MVKKYFSVYVLTVFITGQRQFAQRVDRLAIAIVCCLIVSVIFPVLTLCVCEDLAGGGTVQGASLVISVSSSMTWPQNKAR